MLESVLFNNPIFRSLFDDMICGFAPLRISQRTLHINSANVIPWKWSCYDYIINLGKLIYWDFIQTELLQIEYKSFDVTATQEQLLFHQRVVLWWPSEDRIVVTNLYNTWLKHLLSIKTWSINYAFKNCHYAS